MGRTKSIAEETSASAVEEVGGSSRDFSLRLCGEE
jgi:hypothetical protein